MVLQILFNIRMKKVEKNPSAMEADGRVKIYIKASL